MELSTQSRTYNIKLIIKQERGNMNTLEVDIFGVYEIAIIVTLVNVPNKANYKFTTDDNELCRPYDIYYNNDTSQAYAVRTN